MLKKDWHDRGIDMERKSKACFMEGALVQRRQAGACVTRTRQPPSVCYDAILHYL